MTYAYDSLKRLISATTSSPSWGLSFGYDPFGNRTSETPTKGSAPMSTFTYDQATNHNTSGGFIYDLNGNLTQQYGGATYQYDVENRLISYNTNQEMYFYSPQGQRVWRKAAIGGTPDFYFCAPDDHRLGTYYISTAGYLVVKDTNIWFNGRMITSRGNPTLADKLSSAEQSGPNAFRFFPYGEETSGLSDREMFATYHRDSTTNSTTRASVTIRTRRDGS